MKTLGEVVVDAKNANNLDGLVTFFCALNSDLKNNHESGMCITKVDMTSLVNEDSKAFLDTIKVGSNEDIRDDFVEFAVMAVNSFLFFNMDSRSFIPLNRETIAKNSNTVSTYIPKLAPNDNYYLDIINGNALTDYSTYLRSLGQTNNYGNSNNLSKVYSTSVGKAFSDKSLDAAFINIMFYPVIIASGAILLAVLYVTIALLIK